MKRILSLILVLSMIFTAMLGVISTSAEEETNTAALSVSAANLMLDGNVYLLVAVDYSAFGFDSDITLKVTNKATGAVEIFERDTEVEKTEGFPDESVGFRINSIGARNIADVLSLQPMWCGAESGEAKTYSILEYAVSAKNVDSPALATFVSAIVKFGAEAQLAFGHLSDPKVDAEYVYPLKDESGNIYDYSLVSLRGDAKFANGSSKELLKAGESAVATASSDKSCWINSAAQRVAPDGKTASFSYSEKNSVVYVTGGDVFGKNEYYFNMDDYTGSAYEVGVEKTANLVGQTVSFNKSSGATLGTISVANGYIKTTVGGSLSAIGATNFQQAVGSYIDNKSTFTLSFTLAGDESVDNILSFFGLRVSKPSGYDIYTDAACATALANGGTIYAGKSYYEKDSADPLDYPTYGRLGILRNSSHSTKVLSQTIQNYYIENATSTASYPASWKLNAAAPAAKDGVPTDFLTVHAVFDLENSKIHYYVGDDTELVCSVAMPCSAEFIRNAYVEHAGAANCTMYLKSVIMTKGNIADTFNGITTDDETAVEPDLPIIADQPANEAQAACTHDYEEKSRVEPLPLKNGEIKYECALCGLGAIQAIRMTRSLKVLAIGNSFSVDATTYLWGVCHSAGITDLVVGNAAIGGCSLAKHAGNMKNGVAEYSYTKYVSTSGSTQSEVKIDVALEDEDWDIITIQQVSQNAGMPDTMGDLDYILSYLGEKCPDAEIYWHMTWAYQQDSTHSGFSNYGKDQATMYQAIVDTVNSTILTKDAIPGIIPSGTAMQNLRTTSIGDNVTRDGYHANYGFGRYTIALTWYAILSGGSLDKVNYLPTNEYRAEITANYAAMLESVENAIKTPYAVTPSAGI